MTADLPSYTAVGGVNRHASTGISAVILCREKRNSQFAFFEELEKAGFDYVIFVEENGSPRDIEGLSESFPYVRFIFLKERLSPGEKINLAAFELASPLFFVFWNDMKIIHAGGAQRMAERLMVSRARLQGNDGDTSNQNNSQYIRLCTIPIVQNKRYETIPTLSSPAQINGNFRAVHSVPVREAQPSLYPFDGLGIYDRECFIRLGGFDSNIKNFHWQLMDFGFRSFLWGEEIASTTAIKLAYEKDAPLEDTSSDSHYRRFYLKNLAPVFRGNFANLPFRRFPGFCFRSRLDLFTAWKEFSDARNWIGANYRCFCKDAKLLTDSWKIPETE